MSVLDEFPSACMNYRQQVKDLVLSPDMLLAGLKLKRFIENHQVKPKILTKIEVTEFVAEVFTGAPLYALYYGQHSGNFGHSKYWRANRRSNREGLTVTEYSREGEGRLQPMRLEVVLEGGEREMKKNSSETDESNDHSEVVSGHKTPVSLDDDGIAPLNGRSTLSDEEPLLLDAEDTLPPANNNELVALAWGHGNTTRDMGDKAGAQSCPTKQRRAFKPRSPERPTRRRIPHIVEAASGPSRPQQVPPQTRAAALVVVANTIHMKLTFVTQGWTSVTAGVTATMSTTSTRNRGQSIPS
ncbi:hypothetical protein DFJ43DRAFT_1184171 [Lentinula guzmanii]|uniref:Uncharacterized protein n=1 Tax=Lentinula guzmanii TaxID=2804957 RepID=A0AA38JLJ5_9AGAR|nr:hypothetical protein DFJ43DRAFT_1184171 [Lentinula guzmanii]